MRTFRQIWIYVFIYKGTDVTEQCEGIASGAEFLGVVHTVDDRTAALPGVQEVACTAWIENNNNKRWADSENA